LRYRLSQAELGRDLHGIPTGATIDPGVRPHQDLESVLHQVNLFTIFNHPSGFFSEFDALWMHQSNDGYSPERPGDDFWQFNAYAGYRFLNRRAELRLGVVNLTGQDYRLNPLNLTAYLPRERAFTARLKFNL